MTQDRSIVEAALTGYWVRLQEIEVKIDEIRRQLRQQGAPTGAAKKRSSISRAGRARIAAAQRERWAKIKQEQGRNAR